MCQAEQPHLNQLAEELEGEVAFVGVSNNDTVAEGKQYVENLDVPYAMAHAPEVWEQFDVPYQPVTIVLDGRGEIAARIDGAIEPQALKRAVESVL